MKLYNKSRNEQWDEGNVSMTVTARFGTGGVNTPIVMTYQKVTGPLMANSHPGSYCGQDAYSDMLITGEKDDRKRRTDCRDSGCQLLQGMRHERGAGANDCGGVRTMSEEREQPIYISSDKNHSSIREDGIGATLTANDEDRPMVAHSTVRRLTPLECERLQGYPDGWTDIGEWVDSKGKKHKEADSPRYKALGNSIALPFWKVLIKRISAVYDRDATMASLFDGIGGFPYLWEQINGKGSAVWASEIEEFPMAVTKLRFGGKDNARI